MKRFHDMHALMAITLVLTASCLLAACGGPAGKDGSRVTQRDFRGLAWGSTPSDAATRYPDLVFVGYTLPPGESEPSRIYVREGEDRRLFGVSFDRIEYWFREEQSRETRLHRVTAVLHGRVGPRTLRSRCEAAFDHAAEAIEGIYGRPSEDRQAGLLRAGRFMAWHAGSLRIVLSRSGDGDDGETLLLDVSR
jgi:hypothetical protein